MLIEQHAEQQRERVAAQQFVSSGVPGNAQLWHPGSVPYMVWQRSRPALPGPGLA